MTTLRTQVHRTYQGWQNCFRCGCYEQIDFWLKPMNTKTITNHSFLLLHDCSLKLLSYRGLLLRLAKVALPYPTVHNKPTSSPTVHTRWIEFLSYLSVSTTVTGPPDLHVSACLFVCPLSVPHYTPGQAQTHTG